MGIPQRSLLHKSNGLCVRFNGIIGGEESVVTDKNSLFFSTEEELIQSFISVKYDLHGTYG